MNHRLLLVLPFAVLLAGCGVGIETSVPIPTNAAAGSNPSANPTARGGGRGPVAPTPASTSQKLVD
jgi:hypothetical protein